MRRSHPGDAGFRPASFDRRAYVEHRNHDLQIQFDRTFPASAVQGLDVLDLGCGSGGLSFHVANLGARTVTGVEVDRSQIRIAEEQALTVDTAIRPRFLIAEEPPRIPLPAESVDAVLLFDVVEHLMDYEATMVEIRRTLRPGGRILVWWVPWLNPWGHHIESLVPIPWAHVLFSEKTLIATCTRIYDLPDFTPRAWDLDESGRKRPNKWRNLDRLQDLNRLGVRRFEGVATGLGFRIGRKEVRGFSGSVLARATRPLTGIPWVGELFMSHVVYELVRPEAAAV